MGRGRGCRLMAIAIAVFALAACVPATGPRLPPGGFIDLGDDCDLINPGRGMIALEPLPDGVVLASATRCLVSHIGTPGPHPRFSRVRQRAEAGLDALAQAMRLPSLPRPAVCPQDGSVGGAMITVTDQSGRHYQPALPSEGCQGIRLEVIAAINALPWQVIGTDTVDLTRSKMQDESSCAGTYDAAMADGFVTVDPPASPLVVQLDYTQRPLQVCRYDLDTDPMNAIQLRGSTVVRFGRLTAVSTLDGEAAVAFWSAVGAARPVTKPCTTQAPFAVVFPMAGGAVVEIELGGCFREFVEGETFLRQLDAAAVRKLLPV